MSVYERLNLIRSNLFAARSFLALGAEEPAALDAVVRALIETAEAASELPASLVTLQPELPWAGLAEVAAWRNSTRESHHAEAQMKLDEVEPLTEAVFSVVLGKWEGDAHAGGNSAGWFETPDGGRDYSYAAEIGAVTGEGALLIPGVGTFGCQYLASAAVWVQVSQEAAHALSGSTGMQSWARRLGMGRVRQDGSTPLEPPVDRIWLQSALGEATIVAAHPESETGYSYFRLGELPLRTVSLQATFARIQTMFFLCDDFLPSALWSKEQPLIAAKQAWGGLLAATIHG